MNASQLPAEYIGLPDPGDEDTSRHATKLIPDASKRASVYQFGARWHWKCGPQHQPSRCKGGPARTQAEAYVKAEDHLKAEHDLTLRIHDAAACWCGDNS